MGKTTRSAGLLFAATLLLSSSALGQRDASAAAREGSGSSSDASPDASSDSSTGESAREAHLRALLAQPHASPLDSSALEALETWGEWAAERGYVGYLSADQSTLFFSLARRSGDEELGDIERVEQRLRELLPTPRTRNRGPITGTGGPTTKVYPLGGDRPLWKHDLEPIDLHTGVLFEFDDDRDYAAFVERVRELTPEHETIRHLGERSRSILTTHAAAYVWRVGSCPDGNQVVHAAAQFVLEQRFRFLPDWLRDGLVWAVEDDVAGAVRCLPDGRGESSRDFAQDWRVDARVRPFDGTWVERVERLNDFGSGEHDVLEAGLAFELVEDLLEAAPQNLSNAAEELRLHWEDYAIRHHPRDGLLRVWEYRTPSRVQARILAPLLGPAERRAAADLGE